MKTWRGQYTKMYKGYIAPFICSSTYAIHLGRTCNKLHNISNLLIASYKRFFSRLGICATLTSESGTAFNGADAELKISCLNHQLN